MKEDIVIQKDILSKLSDEEYLLTKRVIGMLLETLAGDQKTRKELLEKLIAKK